MPRKSAARRITKVRDDGRKVTIEYQKLRPKGDEDPDELVLRSIDPPHPHFVNAMKALRKHVAEMLELDAREDWWPDLDIRGVTLTWKDGDRGPNMGIVITAIKELSRGRVSWCFSTPHRTREPYSQQDEEAAEACLTTECCEAMTDLIREAEGYIDGKRAQGNLFKQGEEEAA